MHRAILVLLAMIPSVAVAGPHRDAVLDLLNGYETSAGKAELEAIGDGVDAELMEIADDTSVPSSRRGRAVTALQYFPSDTVRGWLEQHLAGADKSLIRRKAAYALAAAWGEGAVKPLSGALSDADVQVRIAAAGALGQIRSDAAAEALRARLDGEKEPAVRDAIEQALGEGR